MMPPTVVEEPGLANEPMRWDAVSEPGPPVATNRLYAPLPPGESATWPIFSSLMPEIRFPRRVLLGNLVNRGSLLDCFYHNFTERNSSLLLKYPLWSLEVWSVEQRR
jgi:hypothetical protein